MESLPLAPEAAALKPLADAARTSASERFALLKADPAYKAVVNGKASADKFIEKYVVGADKKYLETMQKNLAHDDVAQQTMAAGFVHRLREGAGLLSEGGNFSQSGYNKALESMRPKLALTLKPDVLKDVENLGAVARYVKGQPTGSFVNNSNTAVALMGDAARFGATAAADMAVPGLQIGSKVRKVAEFVKEQKDLSQSMKQYGGIRLKDIK